MTDKIRGGSLTPAYGRDYKSKKAFLADLLAGKDFMYSTFNGGGYASIRDLAVGGSVECRYNNLRSVFVFHMKQSHVSQETPA